MTRAAILIGVKKTGQARVLEAVQSGLDDMRTWLTDQPGFDQRIVELSDAKGEAVTAADVKGAVKRFAKPASGEPRIDQLVIYFGGHGIVKGFMEFWLLSGAHEDVDEAVNVGGSRDLAAHSGIPHVVFISDACRTAAPNIRMQAIQGVSIFAAADPLDEPGGVDTFYAVSLGKSALEIPFADTQYRALYTTALVRALRGDEAELIEPVAGAPHGVIRAWPLRDHLKTAVPDLLREAGFAQSYSQIPNALITSPPSSWLSQVPQPKVRVRGRVVQESLEPQTLETLSQRALDAALRGQAMAASTLRNEGANVPGADLLAEAIEHQSGRGVPAVVADAKVHFMVSGARTVEVAQRATATVGDVDGHLVASLSGLQRPVSVLLVFESGRGALLPALPQLNCRLFLRDGELVSVAYERPSLSPGDRAEIADLQAIIAAAARLGTFRLAPEAARALIARMRDWKAVDPALAVYAAHALRDLLRHAEVASLQEFVRRDLGVSLFDVALLARQPGSAKSSIGSDVFPAVPLLGQAWPLLDAYGIELPPALHGIERHVTDSLWTLFEPSGVEMIRRAIERGDIA